MFKRYLAALACVLTIAIGVQAAPASAATTWMSNYWLIRATTTQDRGIAFVRGQTDRPDIYEARYTYEFLAYDGTWIPTADYVRARDGETKWHPFFPGLPAGILVQLRANHWASAYTTH
jgi:hypothetical protein